MISDQIDEPLYSSALITRKQFHKKIIKFGNMTKLSYTHMNKLLKLIDEGLPPGHKLFKSYTKLIEIFQEKVSFEETIRCVQCLRVIDEKNACSILCEQNGIQRRTENVIEHLFMNKLNQQLIYIIRRNKKLIINYPQVANQILPCDIISSTIYQAKLIHLRATANDTYPITLMLHIDSTPICGWAKKHTWIVMGSIMEIPPPLRENQINMVLFVL
ncbi:unnamed protein product [Rotaria sp. Silwood2]|nr:unnamed protein product [Rotaria sp. Silwood2]CAF3132845.1 unnamed protein product [Rotaria sp. Silwood2]CAF3306711.1 unnamed protein product [Rotaria sp. Silwood2]CAF3985387.1 unnamed protein product [Rotaria sp. Silwood2]CAF4000343.1 unnamed protein product [Rotaria sp. Silwood2]